MQPCNWSDFFWFKISFQVYTVYHYRGFHSGFSTIPVSYPSVRTIPVSIIGLLSKCTCHPSLHCRARFYRLSARCEMNGLFYTSIFLRNECGDFHVRRAVGCGWLLTCSSLGVMACSVQRALYVVHKLAMLRNKFLDSR